MENFNDLTFFTNEEGATLMDRFNRVLRSNTEYFDVLVGYFRISGFYKLCKSINQVKKTRILVGINTDKRTVDLVQQSENNIMFTSSREVNEIYEDKIKGEFENSEDSFDVNEGVKIFLNLLKDKRLEIRAFPSGNIHSKVYIMRKDQEKSDSYGSVITGSSNFTENGLSSNLEFNVELKDSRDVRFALQKFEELWNQSVDLSDTYIDTVNKKTWIREDITPYELYIKLLYEYFKEEINEDKLKDDKVFLIESKELTYQKDAVIRAKKILSQYGGVFLSDVVGLGKTFICAALARELPGRKLVICPPVLQGHWREILNQNGVPSVDIESLGKLDKLIEDGTEEFKYIFIDESHRFRNSDTESFSKLHEICVGKKVVLISATPQNNNIKDLASQIYLFQDKNNSDIIPGYRNIEGYFNKLEKRLKPYNKDDEMYRKILRENSIEIRDDILNNIMVRRTRKEVIKWYKDDLDKNKVNFPILNTPKRLIYEFDDYTDHIFMETIKLIKNLTYARYLPLTYLKNIPTNLKNLLSGQRNMSGFMKAILIKRLESSFYAFNKTIDRFIDSHEKFINMLQSGEVLISKKINVYDLMDAGDDSRIFQLIEEGEILKFNSVEFRQEFINDLGFDLLRLKNIKAMWELVKIDPKLKSFVEELKENPILKDNKILIFTESKESADYLSFNLSKELKGGIIKFTGDSSENLRKTIENNFDPDVKKNNQKNDYRILVATDVLSEGISLHRVGIIINYDLPWNPTKIMQRVGRINRLGTSHEEIYVFNFFPTSQSSKYMSIEENIVNKLQAFHDTLGEDYKYLSDSEEVESYGLFGEELYSKLNSKEAVEEEEEPLNDYMEYLNEIRKIRDNDINLFERIKNLPKKARSSRRTNLTKENSTITMIKKVTLKKFFLSNGTSSKEIKFEDAIRYIKCEEGEKRLSIPKEYFSQLNSNKEFFIELLEDENIEGNQGKKKSKNEQYILKTLKYLRSCREFTEYEYEKIDQFIEMWDVGRVPSKLSKNISEGIKKIIYNPVKVLQYIDDELPQSYKNTPSVKKVSNKDEKHEVILSEYLLGDGEIE